jgi:3-methyladenine DNA glycosylase/8-oxoguanine DNA glycosylase
MSRVKINVAQAQVVFSVAVETVAKADKKLARIIEAVGPCLLKANDIQHPFEALAESIVYQQLTGKAAATIFGRVRTLCQESGPMSPGPMSPTQVQLLAVEELRAAGCSQAKALAIKDLAEKTVSGVVPNIVEMHTLSDEELVERLTAIRGIGTWTVEMLLIFRLGRLNVMPSADYGIRKGFALTYDLPELPTPKALTAYGERWQPYRTIASWYLWRALELPPTFWSKNKNKPSAGAKK